MDVESLTRNIPGGMYQCACDPNLTLLFFSDSFLNLFGYSRAEIDLLFQSQFINMIYPGDRAGVLRTIAGQMRQGPELELEYRVLRRNGGPIWILDKGKLVEDQHAGKSFVSVLVDITERMREREEMRLLLENYKIIMDQTTDIIFEWDIRKDTLKFSSNWHKKFGYDAISEKISQRIPLSENILEEDLPDFVKLMQDTAAGVPYSEAEFRIRDIHGAYVWHHIRATTQYDGDGRAIQAVGIIIDVDQEKKQRQKLLDQAQRDALTGLYNKEAIHRLVEQQMMDTSISGNQVLMIVDVDYFKQVNDTYGHLCGDGLLSDVASILRSCVRRSDYVGRIGGDEFMLYLPQISNGEAARAKGQSILEALEVLRPVSGGPPVTCSIGIAMFPRGGIDFFALYKCADQALYYQKKNGRNGAMLYHPRISADQLPCGLSDTAVSSANVFDESNVVDEKLAQYVFRTLYASEDVGTTIGCLLEIIGRSYDVSCIHIFECAKEGPTSSSFQWCSRAECSTREGEEGHGCMGECLAGQDRFDERGIFYSDQVAQEVLCPMDPAGGNVHSVLQCAIREDEAFLGAVCYCECRPDRSWSPQERNSFQLTASILSTFLTKTRLKERLSAAETGS